MSGPKVVRIVTREEILAICRGQLAQLGAAIEEWERTGRRNQTVSDADVQAVVRRREKLARLLDGDQFVELQKRVPTEIDFLRADAQKRLAAAAAREAAARAVERRTAAVAASVLERLDSRSIAISDDLRRAVVDVASGRSNDGSVVTRALALLAPRPSDAVSERQLQLASALQPDDERETIEQWIARQVPEADATHTRLESRVAELRAVTDDAAASPFEARLDAVAAAAPGRRGLLLDSLEADLAAALHAARARVALQGELRGLAAELSASGHDQLGRVAETILQRIDANDDALRQLRENARRARDGFYAAIAAGARRSAMLSGLAGLGYQVTEGMETAWVQNGHVVVKHGARPGYGLEIAGGADAERLQVRTIAFRSPGAAADPVRDTDAETLWCGELRDLTARFAATGGTIQIAVAKPAGAVPLKIVEDGSVGFATEQTRPTFRERTAG